MNSPRIRFKGYTDAWEQRKFGDEFKLSQGLQVPVEEQFAEQLENTEQFIRIIDVTQEGEPPRYIYNPTGKGRVKTDDIFFVRYGAVGTIGYGYNGVIANNLFKAEPLFKACNMFLFQQFSGTDFNKKLKEMSASTSMPAVNFGALNNLTFSIPSYEEQNKIGEYFGQLDNLITLHQRKCEDTKKLKKFMLQKLFPKDGESAPEIRFEGFTDAWEQRKLSEIADKVSEKNKNNEYNEPLTNSAEQGIISQKDYFDREVVNEDNLDGYYIVRDNDFVYNPRVSVSAPVGPINRNRLGRNGVMSPLYTVFRTHDIDAMYLEYYYKTTKWHRFMKLNGDSGARFDRFTISSTLFMEMPIPYPSIEEQEKIGGYFDSLDKLITLHQRKLDELQKLKKFMLQSMFV